MIKYIHVQWEWWRIIYTICVVLKNNCMLYNCGPETCNKVKHLSKAWWNTAILLISNPKYTCQLPSAVPYLSDGKRKEGNQVQLPPPNAAVYQAVCLYLHPHSAGGMSHHHQDWNKDTACLCLPITILINQPREPALFSHAVNYNLKILMKQSTTTELMKSTHPLFSIVPERI